MKFKVTFVREVIEYDYFERTIEVATEAEAQALADKIASAANMSCPDDAAQRGASHCEDWGIDGMEPCK